MVGLLTLPNLMPEIKMFYLYTLLRFFNLNYTRRKKYLSICTYFWNKPARISHWSQSNCQHIHESHNSLVYCTSWDLCSPPFCVARLIFFWRLFAHFTCAAPPSNHHISCNHNSHICSTAHLNQTSSSHYTPIISSFLSLVAASTLSSPHRVLRTLLHNA